MPAYTSIQPQVANRIASSHLEFNLSLSDDVTLATSNTDAAVVSVFQSDGVRDSTLSVVASLTALIVLKSTGADISWAIEQQATRDADWLEVATGTVTAGADQVAIYDTSAGDAYLAGANIRIKLWGSASVTAFQLNGCLK